MKATAVEIWHVAEGLPLLIQDGATIIQSCRPTLSLRTMQTSLPCCSLGKGRYRWKPNWKQRFGPYPCLSGR